MRRVFGRLEDRQVRRNAETVGRPASGDLRAPVVWWSLRFISGPVLFEEMLLGVLYPTIPEYT